MSYLPRKSTLAPRCATLFLALLALTITLSAQPQPGLTDAGRSSCSLDLSSLSAVSAAITYADDQYERISQTGHSFAGVDLATLSLPAFPESLGLEFISAERVELKTHSVVFLQARDGRRIGFRDDGTASVPQCFGVCVTPDECSVRAGDPADCWCFGWNECGDLF